MKLKITLSAFFILCSFLSSAQIDPVGHLTIFSENGDKFYLILNGERQNDIPQTNLRIEDLNQPYYSAKIIFADKSLPEISKNYLPLTDGNGVYQEVTYKIKRDKNNKSKMKLNFFSQLPVRQNYIAPSNVYVLHYGQPQPAVSMGVGTNVNMGVNMNVNVNINDSGNHSDDNHDNHNHDSHDHDNHAPKDCNNRYAMNADDFAAAFSTVKKQSFEDTKLKTAKQIATANCLDTNQIAAICKIFGFEDSKLDFAKFAYDYCTERKNYFKLNTLFAFSSNVDDLTEYIQSKN
ncbi:MAG TPA: DUF4476 domain-containing protein [Flavobacterium sp.]|nr:DUF4476 domain-containing protein [Flavobacterium sp.]